jgi:hypothetical protein
VEEEAAFENPWQLIPLINDSKEGLTYNIQSLVYNQSY